jgi:hypothetical protein
MTVHDTIKQAMVEYPRIFPSRVQVIHHLFWVIGNGYEWKDGELISIDPPHPITPYQTDKNSMEQNAEWREVLSDPALYDTLFAGREKSLVDFSKFVFDNDNFVDSYRIDLNDVYPLSEYAKVLTVPSDVKKDWLNAAWESISDVDFLLDFERDKKESKKIAGWIKQAEEYLSKVGENGRI